ncbi:hypothetical protein C8J57DRAFT_1378168 [Mycena rebaudengoi]|nr:hypothetical protein C8J57DRAFT_1378168 [Mycena rebaudengoi]
MSMSPTLSFPTLEHEAATSVQEGLLHPPASVPVPADVADPDAAIHYSPPDVGHGQASMDANDDTLLQLNAHPTAVPMLVDVADPHAPAHSPPNVGHEQTAMAPNDDTLLQLKAIAKASKELADTLASRGNLTGHANNIQDVHRAYARYLVLYPDQDDPDYQNVKMKVVVLEEQFAGTGLITEPLFDFPLMASLGTD